MQTAWGNVSRFNSIQKLLRNKCTSSAGSASSEGELSDRCARSATRPSDGGEDRKRIVSREKEVSGASFLTHRA